MTLHDGRRTVKTALAPVNYDYCTALKEELAADRALQQDLIEACDEAIQLLELIDVDGFWERRSKLRLVPDLCDG